jgi:hypothetical protein
MPAVVFTLEDFFDAHLRTMLDLSVQVRELSDLDKRPFDPGESVADRHHKIARLGKQLADTVAALDAILAVTRGGSDHPDPTPTNPTNTGTN